MVTLLRRHFLLVLGGALLLGVAGIGLARIGGGEGGVSGRGRASGAVPVIVSEVGRETFRDRIEALGTARSNESVVITAKVTETVRRLAFEDGMEVEKGVVLVEFTGDEEAANVAEARSEYADALRNYERIETLHREGTAPRSQLDSALASRDSARARVDAIEARLADRLIRAPFAGVLGLRVVSPGTLVQPGDVITTLDDVSVIKLDFAVPETFLAAVRPGYEVVARSAAWPDREFRGQVKTINSRVDPVTRAVTVRAEIPNAERRLRPGMLLTVELIRTRRSALTVPEDALVPVQDRHFVYLVGDDDVVERRDVEIGRRRVGVVEVLAGLEAGERVVVEGTVRVRPGARVDVKSER